MVNHRVTEPRTTWRYLGERSFAEGLSKAAMSGLVGVGAATSSERDYVTRILTAGVLRELGRGGVRGAAGIVPAWP